MAGMRLPEAMKRKKAVFLDLDNTLYAYEPCHRHGLQEAYRFYRRKVARLSYRAFRQGYHRARAAVHQRLPEQAASHSRLLYFQQMLEDTKGKTDVRNSLRLEKAYWNGFFKRMKRYAWVLPFLRQCRKQGQRILIVTNLTSRLQMKKLLRLRLERWIDFLVTSEEAGKEKPARAVYDLALKKSGCRPHEVLLIGDDPRTDTVDTIEFVHPSYFFSRT